MLTRFGAIAIAAFTILSPVICISVEGAPQALSLVRIELNQETLTLDVSPSGNGTASITGRVYLQYPIPLRVDYIDVFIEPEVPDYAGLILSPTEFRLSSTSPEALFQGNLTVPSSLSSTTSGAVRIGGSAMLQPQGTPTGVESDSANIEILPYYGATMYFLKVFGKVDSGGSGTFTLQINNTGNADDAYTLALLDASGLSSKGISLEFEKEQDVPEGGSVQVKVVVRAHNAERGAHIIRIEAISHGKGGSEPEPSVAMLTVTVEDRIISFLKGSPYALIALIVGAVISIAVISAGTSLFLRRRRWKRQFNSMMEAATRENLGLTPPPPRTPPPG